MGEPTFITPVDVTPGATGWQDADAGLPAGATGVVLHFVNTGASSYSIGFRSNGSTDDRRRNLSPNCHMWAVIGVDENGICEVSIAGLTYLKVYAVGYFTSGAVFFTNGVDKTLSTNGVWTDISIATDTGADTAIAAVFQLTCHTSLTTYNLRCNGSTDNRLQTGYNHNKASMIVGVDGSEVCEGYVSDYTVDLLFLVGYIKSGVTMLVNATDLSPGTTGDWTDLAALPSGATGGFIEVATDNVAYYFGLRENGSAEDIYQRAIRSSFGVVEADASRLIEGKIENLACDLWLLGYPTAAAGGLSIPVAQHHYQQQMRAA